MASGQIIERSWTGGVTNDSYMGIKNSFQYAENLNVFDDMRGIKLSSKVQQRAKSKRIFKSFGDEGCVAVPVF
ncbi:MAG: hypothetical protein LBD75_07165 [Candidatus Peribacteria bacterium]|jgi:hypothetical protein|nr:hypothetical protein [Candidatus Peribacteria bacterium]